MYQTVRYRVDDLLPRPVTDWKFIALLATWVSFGVGSLGLFLVIGYVWLLGMRLATTAEARVHSVFSWRGVVLLAMWAFLVAGSWAVFIGLGYLWFLGIGLVLSWI